MRHLSIPVITAISTLTIVQLASAAELSQNPGGICVGTGGLFTRGPIARGGQARAEKGMGSSESNGL